MTYDILSEPMELEDLFAHVDIDIERKFNDEISELKDEITNLRKRVAELEKLHEFDQQQSKSLFKNTMTLQGRIDAQKKRNRREFLHMF